MAQAASPGARVVYVDNDPMVIAHSRALKAGGGTAVIEADLREPGAILDHPATRALIDFSRPLAVLLVAVLHSISASDDPHAVVAALLGACPPGSYLMLTHATDGISGGSAASVAEHYRDHVTPGATLRSREEILRFFTGLELVEPGLVQVPYWRPDEPAPADAGKVWFLGAVGRKPSVGAAGCVHAGCHAQSEQGGQGNIAAGQPHPRGSAARRPPRARSWPVKVECAGRGGTGFVEVIRVPAAGPQPNSRTLPPATRPAMSWRRCWLRRRSTCLYFLDPLGTERYLAERIFAAKPRPAPVREQRSG